MSFWTAIALIAIVAIIFGGFGNRHRRSSRHREHDHEMPEADTVSVTEREKELQREVEELRERIQVLERIATDDRGAKRLADEIEELRLEGKEDSR